MKHWIGVVSLSSVLNKVKDGSHNWFCLNPAVSVGDTLFLYATNSTSKTPGVFGLFEITNIDSKKNGMCSVYSTNFAATNTYSEFKILKIYQNPLPFPAIKSNPILASSQPARRLFRGTCFSISKTEYTEFLRVLDVV